jgi:transcriptional regulator with XRE-family HTH domain
MAALKEEKIHLGRNIKRIREILGIKQEALALELGDDWSQKKISLVETKAEIEPATLQKISNALGVNIDAIRYFDEYSVIEFIRRSFNNEGNYGTTNLSQVDHHFSFNPVDKVIELYERMLHDQSEMIKRLQELIQQDRESYNGKHQELESLMINRHTVYESSSPYKVIHGFQSLN